MNILLSIVWFLFAVLFGVLAVHHRKLSRRGISHFGEMPKYGKPALRWVQSDITSEDINAMVQDFSARFNSYVDAQNTTAEKLNRALSAGYWVACGTAIFSAVLVWFAL